jgi:Transmembrane amino acid transporter protein
VLLGNIGILVVTAFSYPLVHYPARETLIGIFTKRDSKVVHYAVTTVLVATTFAIAVIPGLNLGVVFGVCGSSSGLFIVFTFPALVYIRLHPSRRSAPKKVLAWLVVVLGCLFTVICLYAVLVPQR